MPDYVMNSLAMQSWNWPAVKKCAQLVRKPSLLIPNLSFKNIATIDWIRLRDEHGIEAICFDKDNTLTAPYSLNLHFSIIDSLEACKNLFQGQVVVFSNSIGSSSFDANFAKADLFTKTTGIPVVRHNSKKPDGALDILAYFKGLKPKQIALIGDRVLTDIVMANEAGFLSVLVTDPLTIQGDNIPAIISRLFEKQLLKILNRK